MADRNNTTYSVCSVNGCVNLANRVGANLCEMHYMRVRRHGGTEKQSTLIDGNLEHSGGYVLVHAPHHPLRTTSARVYEHRIVYYNANGAGPFNCYWCNKAVGWDDMHVDHLNSIVVDNRISNLVASCPVCNQQRGNAKMRKTKRERSHRRYTAHGLTKCISEWAKYLGLSRNTLEYRLGAGWSLNKVFSPRIGTSGPKSRLCGGLK